MSGFEAIGLVIAGLQLCFAFVVVLSLPLAAKRGNATAGTLFVILALATVVWITRSVLWQP